MRCDRIYFEKSSHFETTRELAFQIADQFRAFGSSINLRVSVIVGGMGM
jgi:superfamily II DNA/RNA helicase